MNNKITARKIEGFKPSVLNNCVCHNEMNKLEKAFEEIENWYWCAEQEGMTYENEISYLDYIKKHIDNLQSKIDKATEWLDKNTDWKDFNCRELKFDENSKPEKLLDILKEDK